MKLSENLVTTPREKFENLITGKFEYKIKTVSDNEDLLLFYQYDEIGQEICIAVADYTNNNFQIDHKFL